jgi:hypothetical protein
LSSAANGTAEGTRSHRDSAAVLFGLGLILGGLLGEVSQRPMVGLMFLWAGVIVLLLSRRLRLSYYLGRCVAKIKT